MILLMNVYKKMLLSFLAGLLGVTLFSLAWANVGNATIHNKDTVKGWFTKSNFYSQIVDVALEKARASANKDTPPGQVAITENDGMGSLPIKDPAVQAIAKQAFSPALIQTSVESLLNGSYNWLDGSAKDIAFKIDLTSAKEQLVTGLGTYVANRVATLPVCANNQIPQDFDGFNATCRPSFLSPAQAGSEFSANLLKQDFLKDPVITADTIKTKNNNGTEVPLSSDANVKFVKDAYQRSGQLPVALSVIALLLTLAIIFLSISKLRGVRRAGYVFIVIGVLLLLIYFGLSTMTTQTSEKLSVSGIKSPEQTKLFLDFGKIVITDIQKVLVRYIAAYLVVGTACLALVYILHKRRSLLEQPADIAHTTEPVKPINTPPEVLEKTKKDND